MKREEKHRKDQKPSKYYRKNLNYKNQQENNQKIQFSYTQIVSK